MPVEIAKHGGVRRLAVPGLTDRIVERALLAELDPVIDPLPLPWSSPTSADSECGTRWPAWRPTRPERRRSRGGT
jgi:hypothetical protein